MLRRSWCDLPRCSRGRPVVNVAAWKANVTCEIADQIENLLVRESNCQSSSLLRCSKERNANVLQRHRVAAPTQFQNTPVVSITLDANHDSVMSQTGDRRWSAVGALNKQQTLRTPL